MKTIKRYIMDSLTYIVIPMAYPLPESQFRPKFIIYNSIEGV